MKLIKKIFIANLVALSFFITGPLTTNESNPEVTIVSENNDDFEKNTSLKDYKPCTIDTITTI